MRPASILSTVLLAAAGAITVAGSAAAQSAAPSPGEARGLRYLTWSGRGPNTAPADAPAVAATAQPVEPAPVRRDLRRPNTVIPHGGFVTADASPHPGLTPAPGSGRTLTPASAWLQPRPLAPPPPPPPPAPEISAPSAPTDYLADRGGRDQPLPAETIYARPAAAPPPPPPAAVMAPRRETPVYRRESSAPVQPAPDAAPVDPMAPRRDAPVFHMESSAAVQPAPETAAVDPMAPRRDAPIFHMESAAAVQPDAEAQAAVDPDASRRPRRLAEVVPTGERPPVSNARYYSVHRQNGRQPDALEMPAPTYIDALAVTMTETPASQDLAEPDAAPTLIRDAQGRVRPAPAASDGDHQ